MREQLLASILLVRAGFINIKVYNDLLDSYFELDTNNDLLCELEWNADKMDVSVNLLLRSGAFDKDLFIKSMLDILKKIYDENKFSLKEFAEHGYILWSSLPVFHSEKPLNIFCYLDNTLSCDGEGTCRELLNNIFGHYDELISKTHTK